MLIIIILGRCRWSKLVVSVSRQLMQDWRLCNLPKSRVIFCLIIIITTITIITI